MWQVTPGAPCNLLSLDEEELEDELGGSKYRVEELPARTADHFAFLSGRDDDRVVTRLLTAGYRWAWTADPGFVQTTDLPHQIPHVLINDHVSDPVLPAKMSSLMHRIGVVR